MENEAKDKLVQLLVDSLMNNVSDWKHESWGLYNKKLFIQISTNYDTSISIPFRMEFNRSQRKKLNKAIEYCKCMSILNKKNDGK